MNETASSEELNEQGHKELWSLRCQMDANENSMGDVKSGCQVNSESLIQYIPQTLDLNVGSL